MAKITFDSHESFNKIPVIDRAKEREYETRRAEGYHNSLMAQGNAQRSHEIVKTTLVCITAFLGCIAFLIFLAVRH